MNLLRSTLTLLLLLTTILLLYLYATSWHSPQCLAAWKRDNSYMLATHHGSLWLTFESTDDLETPCPPSLTLRRFSAEKETPLSIAPPIFSPPTGNTGGASGFSSAGLFSDPPNALNAKRNLLTNPPSALPTFWKFHLFGFALGAQSSKIVFGTFPPGAPTFSKTYIAIIPLWLICLALLLLSFLATKPYRVRLYRKRHHLCLTCGYDLRASTSRCPECATPIPPALAPSPFFKRIPTMLSRFFSRISAFTTAHPLATGLSFLLLAIAIVLLSPRPKPQIVYIEAATAPTSRPVLGKPVFLHFTDTPLLEVVKDLSQQSGTTILLHTSKLQETGIDDSTKVSATSTGPVPLDTALQVLLPQPANTALFLDDDGILHISAPSEIYEKNQIVKHYDITDFLALDTDPLLPRGNPTPTADALASLIREVVRPTCWRENGGTNSIRLFDKQLIISAPLQIHREIATFLTDLRRSKTLTIPNPPTINLP